jgi:PleD family two-component response regulator
VLKIKTRFDFRRNSVSIGGLMTKPLALVYYERLMPGTQLVNRLQDLGYRVQTVTEPALIMGSARTDRPMIALLDLVTTRANIFSIIKEMKADEETGHIPVVGFAAQTDHRLHDEATRSGATLVAYDDALLPQLPHLLEHALQVD